MHCFVGLPIPEGKDALNIIASELYGAEESDELFEEAESPEEAPEANAAEEAEEPAEEAVPEVTEETLAEVAPDEEI